MNNLDTNYLNLCKDILDNGIVKKDRTGTGTKSIFGRQIRHKMSEGFPLLTTKKMSLKNIATELRWFLNGDTNIKFLVDRKCNIWNGDAYKNFVNTVEKNRPDGYTRPLLTQEEFVQNIKIDPEFAEHWGELGPIYGKQWRAWEKYGYRGLKPKKERGAAEKLFKAGHIDQIQNLIDDLKNNPDSRRLMINAWNVDEIGKVVLPPCHYGFQCYTRELSDEEKYAIFPNLKTLKDEKYNFVREQNFVKAAELRLKEVKLMEKLPTRALTLMWNQRSVDTALGLPYNIASYAMLLTILANEVNMVPDELIANLGDTHLYLNHLDEIQIQMVNEPYDLPTLKMIGGIDSPLDGTDFELIDYKSHAAITFPLSN